MANGYTEIEKDTANAERGIIPDVLVSKYGNHAPAAAVFDKGVSDEAGAAAAADANRKAHDYGRKS
jgi:hypothetical protein